MGYETKLVLGYPYNFRATDEKLGVTLLCKVAEVDLCKVSTSSTTGHLLSHCRETIPTYAYYADDGNTVITEDRYGDRLSAVPIPELLKALERDQEVETYRRFTLAYGLLDAVFESDWRGELVCIQYGH